MHLGKTSSIFLLPLSSSDPHPSLGLLYCCSVPARVPKQVVKLEILNCEQSKTVNLWLRKLA